MDTSVVRWWRSYLRKRILTPLAMVVQILIILALVVPVVVLAPESVRLVAAIGFVAYCGVGLAFNLRQRSKSNGRPFYHVVLLSCASLDHRWVEVPTSEVQDDIEATKTQAVLQAFRCHDCAVVRLDGADMTGKPFMVMRNHEFAVEGWHVGFFFRLSRFSPVASGSSVQATDESQ